MDNLSFTTFIKITLQNSTQAKTGEVQRLLNGQGGYDFYKRLKLAAREVAQGITDPQIILDELSSIKKKAEREHNIAVATRFRDWWIAKGADVVAHDERPAAIFRRPGMPFGIRLTPEICHTEAGQKRVTYLWASATPALTKQGAAIGIMILQEALRKDKYEDHVFSIFDLRRNRILGEECVTNASKTHLAADLAQIGAIWEQIAS